MDYQLCAVRRRRAAVGGTKKMDRLTTIKCRLGKYLKKLVTIAIVFLTFFG